MSHKRLQEFFDLTNFLLDSFLPAELEAIADRIVFCSVGSNNLDHTAAGNRSLGRTSFLGGATMKSRPLPPSAVSHRHLLSLGAERFSSLIAPLFVSLHVKSTLQSRLEGAIINILNEDPHKYYLLDKDVRSLYKTGKCSSSIANRSKPKRVMAPAKTVFGHYG